MISVDYVLCFSFIYSNHRHVQDQKGVRDNSSTQGYKTISIKLNDRVTNVWEVIWKLRDDKMTIS